MSGDAASPATEIKAFLDSLGMLGEIIVGDIHPTPDALGAIKEYGGRAPERLFGVVGVGWEKPTIQIMFRDAPFEYDMPMRKCRIAWHQLTSVQPGLISPGSATYLTIDPQQSPHSLGKDLNDRYEIVCNFYIWKEPHP